MRACPRRVLTLVVLALVAPVRSALGAPVPSVPTPRAAAPTCDPNAITPYVDRGMLYGPGQAGMSLAFHGNTAPVDGSRGDASIGFAVGLTSRLTLDGSLGTISIADAARYHDPRVALWFGIVDTAPVEVDLTSAVAFGVHDDERVLHAFEPGAVAIFRLGGDARIDAGAYLPLALDGAHGVGLHAPARLAIQVAHDVHLGLVSGVEIASFGAGAATVPLGLELGVTVPLGSGGYAMLTPSLSWPRFLAFHRGEDIASPGPLAVGMSFGVVTPP